jgi:hypothetical protein
VRLASLLATVFPRWAGLHLDAISLVEQQILVDPSSTRRWARCSDCGQRSRGVHSAFTRVLAEMRGPSDRWYERVQTADFQVFELYRDNAAGDVWVLDVMQD